MHPTPDAARAALITPPGEGGISVIALSGAGARAVLESCFRGTRRRAEGIRPGAIAHGWIVRGESALDEVIVAHFERVCGAPLYEINCHGGAMAARAVLDRLFEAGAEPASWDGLTAGEGGSGEGVLSPSAIHTAALTALPRAKTRLAARMLLHQAAGALAEALDAVRGDLSKGSPGRLEALLDTAALGKALLTPPTVMLAGPPNAGKSTLLNALLRSERVIVHPRPGTTRDVVRELVAIGGVAFEIIDAAGIGSGAGGADARAAQRAADMVRECDVVLLVFDARREASCELRGLPAPRPSARKILVGNKIDLMPSAPGPVALPAHLKCAAQVFISAREGRDLGQIEAALLEPYGAQIDACARGGAVVFSDKIARAIERVAARLAQSGPTEALEELAGLS